MEPIAFVGGSGPQGRGLALQLAIAGHPVAIGSRDADRATQAAVELRALAGPGARIAGAANLDACTGAEVVFVVVPYAAQASTLPPLAQAVAGKVVVCCVNALAFDGRGPHPMRVEGGSAAEECAALLPAARVASAFQNVSARKLAEPRTRIEVDVLVCSDDEGAAEVTARLVERIPGMRAVHAGPLRLSQPIEDMTAVLLAVNRRYGTHAGIRIAGV